jgi:hypothetical protein
MLASLPSVTPVSDAASSADGISDSFDYSTELPSVPPMSDTFGLVICDDLANFIRRIKLPADSRALAAPEEDFIFRSVVPATCRPASSKC